MPDLSMTRVSRYASHRATTGEDVTLKDVVDEIRNPPKATLEILSKLAAAAGESEEAQKTIKGKLPAIIPAGVFTDGNRNDNGLAIASNLLVLDFDTIKDAEGREDLTRRLLDDQHVAVVFKSPRGGLKAFALCEGIANAEDFRLYFRAFAKRYPNLLDESGKNLSRLCYLSHDAEAVLRPAVPYPRPEGEGVNFDPPEVRTAAAPAPTASTYRPDENIARHLSKVLEKGVNLKALDGTTSRHSFVRSAAVTLKRYVLGGHLTDEQAESVLTDEVRRVFNNDGERVNDALRAYRSPKCYDLAREKGALAPEASTGKTAPATADDVDDDRLAELYKLIYTPTRQLEPPKLPPVFMLKGVDVGQVGSLTVLKAKTKSGKTTVSLAMWTAFYASHLKRDVDTFGFTVTPPEGKDLCLYLDTEETEREAWDSWDRALRRVGFDTDDKQPEVMRESHLVLTNIPSNIDKQAVLFDLIEAAGDRLGAIILDGVADFVKNVNDDNEVDTFMQRLRILAGRHQVAVVVTIHENFGSSKGRGHLGSDLARRARASLQLEKNRDTGVFTLMIEENRVGGDNIKVRFKWSDELQRHVTIEAANIEEILTEDVRKILEPHSGKLLSAKELREIIANGAGIGVEAAKKRLQRYVKDGVIEVRGGGRSISYRVKYFGTAGKQDDPPADEGEESLF